MNTASAFHRYAGAAALAAAAGGLLYSIAFVVLRNGLLASLCLMLGGALSLVVLVALFARLGEVDWPPAMLGLLLGAAGALGATVHGGYDLANLLNPPGALPDAVNNLPNPIDPRGLLTFGVAGLSLVVAGLLMRRHPLFKGVLATLTLVLAALLVIVYLARLIVLTPTSPLVLLPAALTGFAVNPLWYLILGLRLRQEESAPSVAALPTGAAHPQI